jgi:hypothetical protein
VEAALKSLMKDTVTVEPYASQNKAGEVSYGSAVTYKGRCVGRTRAIRDFKGQERVSTVTTYFAGNADITPRDRITLPSHFVPRQPPIMAIANLPDEHGRHHTVVYT